MLHVLADVPTCCMFKFTKCSGHVVVAKKATRGVTNELELFVCAIAFGILSNVEAQEIFNQASGYVFEFREARQLSLPDNLSTFPAFRKASSPCEVNK